ncbi:MAG: hypothetical protein PUB32_00925 [Clostridiales bacterium]|nr:hypothetical protein [Clostridiales bacterium]
MERFKQILNRLLFPRLAVVLISVPVAAALLIYTFAFAGEDSPIAYPAYVFSAYAMVITCAWIIKNAKSSKSGLDSAIHNIPLAHRYLTDVSFKLHVSLYLSLGLNVLYAVIKFVYGVWYHSVWFGTLAVYYFFLAVMRFGLLRHANQNGFGKNIAAELKQYRMCGLVLMLMNVAFSGVVVLVVRKNEGFQYAGYLIYVMAMYAFYNVITAVINVIKYRKYNSPVMSAAKVINLAAALVSMLSLETAMLAQFDNGNNPETFRQIMTGSTGGCVCAIVLGIAIYMVIRSTKQLRKLKTES